MATKPRTLFDKIWDSHVVNRLDDGTCLLYIDRHLVHEVTSAPAFEGLRLAGRKARRPDLALAVPDHNVPTTDRSKGIADEESRIQIDTLRNNAKDFGIEYYDMDDIRQGIVHIIGPEEGFTLPGLTIETVLLLVPAVGIVVWQADSHGGASLGRNWQTDLLLPLSGVITAVPLLLFATATRRMDYSTLGFVQFLAPTIAFLLGLFVFREPLRPIQLVCFVMIWTAIAVFSWDLWARRKAARAG